MTRTAISPKTRMLRFASRWSDVPGAISAYLRRRRAERLRTSADELHLAAFDARTVLRRQEEVFRAMGLDRDRGVAAYAGFVSAFPQLRNSGFSEHSHLFGAIASSEVWSPRVTRILEIGTYDGVNALLLAHLFPQAMVTTIDLPEEHPLFVSSYGRDGSQARSEFVARRDATLSRLPNVELRQVDSIALTLLPCDSGASRFDIVWIDGAHGYPTCAIDIVNALRIVAEEGLILCDDVYVPDNTSATDSDPMYRSIAAWETLSAFERESIVTMTLADKRLDPLHTRPSVRKFVAVCRRTRSASPVFGLTAFSR